MKNPAEYLNKNFLLHADMINALTDSETEIVYSEDDGVLLEKEGLVWFLSASSKDAAERMAKMVKGNGDVVVHQEEYAKAVLKIVGERRTLPCRQCCYEGKEPVAVAKIEGYSFRKLKKEDIDFICENYEDYGDDRNYIEKCIQRGMFGAFNNGKCVGFIGEHREGAIGLLKIMPEHRRKGLGFALEGMMINKELQKGKIPFDHVVIGNEASMSLQQKLGMTFAKETVVWLFLE